MSESKTLIAHRAAAKRSLIQFSSLLVLTTLITGLLGLFAVWSLNKTHDRTEAQLEQATAVIDQTRAAQVQFKIQVQEWKNFLLRGAEPADRDLYLSAFLKSEARARAILVDLGDRPEFSPDFHFEKSADALLSEHENLSKAYAQARALQDDKHWNYIEMDRAVRGLDRPLNEHIDDFVERVNAQRKDFIRTTIAYEQHRYYLVARVIWLAMLLTIVLVGVLIWRLFTGRVRVA